jgi:hypothetical protein
MVSTLIGTMNESTLHAGLKAWYAWPTDGLEQNIDGYFVDIVRGDTLIEIQLGNFSSIKRKIRKLLPRHPIRLVCPIATEKWILRIAKNGTTINRRKSPKKGRVEDLFDELIYFPGLVQNENFSLEILLIHEEVLWIDDERGSWRRKGWSVADRRLLEVIGQCIFKSEQDYLKLLPVSLPELFTTQDLSNFSGVSIRLARKMAYCLRYMGAIRPVNKLGKKLVYSINLY